MRYLFLLLSVHFLCANQTEKIFTYIYQQNTWGDPQSISGNGSNLQQTAVIREEIPKLLEKYNIKSILDAPCGDCFWISKINLSLEQYIGTDIVANLIEKNKKQYPDYIFFQKNIIHDPLPKAELILCRDCLVHLTIDQIKTTLRNFKKSGAKFLLTTTFTRNRKNHNIKTGDWRPLNLQNPPFNFPKPLEIINENNSQFGKKYSDKSLALWKIKDLPL